jgi:hypothetical protein
VIGLAPAVLYGRTIMNTASRSAFAALLFSLVPACASDPASMDPMPEPTEDPQPEPTPDPQPDPTPDPTPTPLASGELDPTFGTGGVKSLTDIGDGYYAAAIATQGQQLIACVSKLVGNSMEGQLIRLDTDGTVDKAFASDGVLSLNINGITHSACSGIAVLDDKIAFTVTNLDNSVRTLGWVSSDGKTTYPNSVDVYTAPTRGLGTKAAKVAAGGSSLGKPGIGFLEPGWSAYAYTAVAVTGTTTRALLSDDNAYIVGSFDTDNTGKRWWSVYGNSNGTMVKVGGSVSAGLAGTPDLLLDATLLPDGSIFAVGGVDTGKEVMAARFTSDSVYPERHPHGGVSLARAIVLDSAGRPVVVGNASAGSDSVFGWQRYDVSGGADIALDLTYRDGGLASVAPPSGQGELVGAARLGDRIYALGQYDVQSATPKLALVKIAD